MKQTIIVKVGTNVICQDNGLLDQGIMENLVQQLITLQKKYQVVLISSGAVGAGSGCVKILPKTREIERRQLLAAVGQPKLLTRYQEIFAKQDAECAQILVTKSDFRDREHYLNMKQCFEVLLRHDVIPIVNENDAVAVSELMFTDNDELSGLIASLVQAKMLLILTSVDGLYTAHPDDPEAEMISEIDPTRDDFEQFVSPQKSSFGRGGMLTKCRLAQKMSKLGIETHILNGKVPDNIIRLFDEQKLGTKFLASKKHSSKKQWIAQSDGYEKGFITINAKAQEALQDHSIARSLLPIGIVKVEGKFEKKDIIKICNEAGEEIGIGRAEYDADTARSLLGQKNKKPLVYYDFLHWF